MEFHFSSLLGLKFDLIKPEVVCSKVYDFIDLSGSGKASSKKLDVSYEDSPLVFEIENLCLKNNSTS